MPAVGLHRKGELCAEAVPQGKARGRGSSGLQGRIRAPSQLGGTPGPEDVGECLGLSVRVCVGGGCFHGLVSFIIKSDLVMHTELTRPFLDCSVLGA